MALGAWTFVLHPPGDLKDGPDGRFIAILITLMVILVLTVILGAGGFWDVIK